MIRVFLLILVTALATPVAALAQDKNKVTAPVVPSERSAHDLHTDFAIVIAVIALSGAIGGLATGIGAQRTNEITLPAWGANLGTPRLLRLGCLGDILIGTTASFAIHFIYDPITNITEPDTSKVSYLMRLISLGILSGFMGIKVLSTLSDTFVQQLQSKGKQILDQMHSQQRARELLLFTDKSLEDIENTAKTDKARALTDLDNAEAGVKQILEATPNDPHTLVILGKIYKRRWQYSGTTQYLEQAVQILTQAINADPLYDRAYYNRACYYALLGKQDEAVKDLQRAITLFSQNRFFAKDDTDLASLKTRTEWKGLVDAL